MPNTLPYAPPDCFTLCSAFLDMCEIEVDRGDWKGFTLLTYDTTPGYTDTQLFPSAPVKWTYRPSTA